jgi:hypothetical protein
MYDKFQYHLEDMECKMCAFFGGRKNGCQYNGSNQLKSTTCCCEDEKHEAVENGRLKRKRGVMAWVG